MHHARMRIRLRPSEGLCGKCTLCVRVCVSCARTQTRVGASTPLLQGGAWTFRSCVFVGTCARVRARGHIGHLSARAASTQRRRQAHAHIPSPSPRQARNALCLRPSRRMMLGWRATFWLGTVLVLRLWLLLQCHNTTRDSSRPHI